LKLATPFFSNSPPKGRGRGKSWCQARKFFSQPGPTVGKKKSQRKKADLWEEKRAPKPRQKEWSKSRGEKKTKKTGVGLNPAWPTWGGWKTPGKNPSRKRLAKEKIQPTKKKRGGGFG